MFLKLAAYCRRPALRMVVLDLSCHHWCLAQQGLLVEDAGEYHHSAAMVTTAQRQRQLLEAAHCHQAAASFLLVATARMFLLKPH
jgi:hypothetical protein